MADTVLEKPDPLAFDNFLRREGNNLRVGDKAPATRNAWEERRVRLRIRMLEAAGLMDEPLFSPLEVKELGALKRTGYRIEKLAIQTRPDVWMTANAYVPEPAKGKLPAVLVVHGHWPWARIDPTVQARCLGLVKLGFFVLAVDAFGAGERYTAPARGTYHGALFGSTLWPTGRTLLGMQIYDNRRAVDYLQTRPEVDRERLGITGASGGGNQTMYAGALDDRLQAVVPVCSVGTYQAYLRAACCVCEVLPGALRFTEEGDVLGLVVPRALMVVSATRDAFQFSVGEAEKSVARARTIYGLYEEPGKVHHAIFESPHAYNQPMREAMYGWMTRWLKGEGDGKPIAEPAHDVEKPEDLRCFPDDVRPRGFLLPPTFAAEHGRVLAASKDRREWKHIEDWDAHAVYAREQLRRNVLGGFPPRNTAVKLVRGTEADGVTTTAVLLSPEPDVSVPALLRANGKMDDTKPACVLLHLEGKGEALKHPLAEALLKAGWAVLAPDLRGTGETKPEGGGIRGAPDHTIAEHALWIGRPLLGQWVCDVRAMVEWLTGNPATERRRVVVAGLGHAGLVALIAGGLLDRVDGVVALGSLATYITEEEYAPGTPMGLLAPGILRLGDVPHLAALTAPRRLVITEPVSPQGQKLAARKVEEGFAFTRMIYQLHKSPERLTMATEIRPEDLASRL